MQIISTKKWNALQTQIKALQTSQLQNFFNNFNTQIFPHWQVFKEVAAYTTLDDIYSVVSRLATTAAMIPQCAYDANGEELPPTDPVNKFLSTLTFDEKEKMYTYLYLMGEVFMYKEKLELGPNAGMKKVHFLHPGRVVVVLSESFPSKIIGYKYYDTNRGIDFNIAVEDMVFRKFFNPSIDSMQEWRGLSPVKVLMQRLNRVQANMDVSTAQMQNGGLPGIIYSKLPGANTEAWNQMKETFARFKNNSDNAGSPYMGGLPDMGYIEIGSTLADMDLAALADMDFKKICNAYSISDVLFNADKGAKYDNANQFEKAMYTNAILPQVMRIDAAINEAIVPELKSKAIVRCNLSNISVLQENMKEKAEGWAAMPAIVINEMRTAMDQDESTDPMADKLLVKTGYVLSDDLNIDVEPIEDTANDYGKPDKSNR